MVFYSPCSPNQQESERRSEKRERKNEVINMADERQQSVQDEQDVSIPAELAQIETFQNTVDEKNLKLVTSVDILQQALQETEASAPVHFTNAETSGLQETTHHLSDHSYIHSSNSIVNVSSCDINSQDVDSSDNCLKEGNDSSNLPISSVSLQTTENVTDLNSPQILTPSVFSEESNKICLNGDVLSFSTISNSANIDVFSNSVINSHASTGNPLTCDNNSIIETPVTENLNPEFIIRNNNPQINATPVIENSNPVFVVRNDNSAPAAAPVAGNSNPIFIIRNENPTAVASSFSLPSTSQEVPSIKVPVKQTNAPLGSLKNPIQIIQAGNSYHSTQTLTPAQLHQISHVLQKQQAKKILESKGKSVVYDPSTKTRIVCRIVHPSELQSQVSQDVSLDSPSQEIAVPKSNSFRGRGRPRKFQGRKLKEDENSPALSKEEREEKKKHRPRTRSGRISKPPSYMVKDYKRIHHLDFNEEPHDDSDGGYSDYQVSGDESEKRSPKSHSLPPGVTTAKQRNYSCQSCSKAYIGRGGLSRHYRTHPSHGSMAEGEDVSTQDENSNSSLASSILSNSGCNNSGQTSIFNHISQTSISDISNQISNSNQALAVAYNINNSQTSNSDNYSQTSNSGSSSQPVISSTIPHVELSKVVVEESPPVQAVPEMTNNLLSNRRKAKLREVLKNYTDEEVAEVLLPKFAQQVSLWDFFIAKVSKEPGGLSIFDMLTEFEKFLTLMRKETHNCLLPANLKDGQEKTIINISSKEIATALSLNMGSYMVTTQSSIPEFAAKTSTKEFRLNNNASDVLGVTSDTPLFKRKRLDVSVEEVSTRLPEQILSDAIPDSDNLELQLADETLSSSVELSSHDVHLLNSVCHVDNHPDMVTKGLYDLGSSTVVTPSSLSSGCLSAVNASRNASVPSLTVRSPQKVPNIQVRKLHLFGTNQQQLLPASDVRITVPVNNLSIPSECNLTDLSQIINKEPMLVQKQIEMGSSSIVNKTFQALPLDSSVDIYNQSIQGLPAQAVVLDSSAEANHTVSTVPLINSVDIHNQNVPSDTAQTASVQTELAENIANCLPDSHIASSLHNSSIVATGLQALVPSEINLNASMIEKPREFETTHNVPEVSKLSESSAVLSHLMLPDGQVLSIWSPMENSEKVQNEQFVQNFVPGNLIILQNPDGSIQVPNNQSVPAETLQTLTTLNQGLSNETGTHAFTSVRPM